MAAGLRHTLYNSNKINIMVRHRTKTRHKCHVTEHIVVQSVIMANQKHPSEWALQQS